MQWSHGVVFRCSVGQWISRPEGSSEEPLSLPAYILRTEARIHQMVPSSRRSSRGVACHILSDRNQHSSTSSSTWIRLEGADSRTSGSPRRQPGRGTCLDHRGRVRNAGGKKVPVGRHLERGAQQGQQQEGSQHAKCQVQQAMPQGPCPSLAAGWCAWDGEPLWLDGDSGRGTDSCTSRGGVRAVGKPPKKRTSCASYHPSMRSRRFAGCGRRTGGIGWEWASPQRP